MRNIASGSVEWKNHAGLDTVDLVERVRTASTPCLVLVLAGTRTSDVEGISAAGATAASRRLTPAIDAEALVLGRAVSASALPVSPAGIVSPVVITRAVIELLGVKVIVVDCGTFIAPEVEHHSLLREPAACVSTGRAIVMDDVKVLYESGRRMCRELNEKHDLLLVAECVPGGTTTAAAVLEVLDQPAASSVSSSLPRADKSLRRELISRGLEATKSAASGQKIHPLNAVASVGDGMQAFSAGFASVKESDSRIILAGGSQMLAVSYLVSRMHELEGAGGSCALPVVTTKWVADDAGASTSLLAKQLNVPFACSRPDFWKSRHKGLQAYEEGNVKEGVGAGAVMALAFWKGIAEPELLCAIDRTYDELFLNSSI